MAKPAKAGTKAGDGEKSTSLRLNGKILQVLKIHTIEEDTSVQKIVETLAEVYLKDARKTGS